MLKLFARIWAGIVGAVAGLSLGVLLAVVLLTMQVSLEVGLWTVVILGIVGGIAGLFIGNKKLGVSASFDITAAVKANEDIQISLFCTREFLNELGTGSLLAAPVVYRAR